MTMIPITNSSSVAAYDYDEATQTFSLQFVVKPGKPQPIYDYPDFPKEAFENFLEAESKGAWVHKCIRGDAWRPGGFKGRKRETL